MTTPTEPDPADYGQSLGPDGFMLTLDSGRLAPPDENPEPFTVQQIDVDGLG